MIGTTLGPYQILEKIGQGGMGEVYRARDTRLKRDVAIKVLPASVADDAARLRRFEQEALATAALNHPNILVVFDIGQQNGTTYVVEELLEGRTLREVMKAAAVPVRTAIEYAAQIAHGLSAAHARGIVHRDLKPENLFVSADGHVKILDFGIAKVTETPSAFATTTLIAAGTEPGLVLGTIGYMAPEQVRGAAVDHRADIFSFGAVLYEMLTGRRAFTGDTPADALMAILKDAPADPAESGRAVPGSFVRVVERCLDKQPAGRFQSASDLAFALRTLASEPRSGTEIEAAPAASTSLAPTARHWLFAVAGIVLGVALAAGTSWLLTPRSPPSPFIVLDVKAPADWRLRPGSALSPDGSRLVFTAQRESGGPRQLWIRGRETGDTQLLEGTERAESPFWSPDGGWIGFFDQDWLRAVNPSSRRVRTICDAKGMRRSGTWGAGVIVFSTDAGVPLQKVDDSGNTPAVSMPQLKGSRPFFLPDGRHFVFGGGPGFVTGLFLSDVDLEQSTTLRAEGHDPKYAAGHLLFLVGGSLVAQPFDLDSLRLSATEPVTLADDVATNLQTGATFSVTDGGLLAFHRTSFDRWGLAWYQRSDRTRSPLPDDGGHWRNPELSPNDTEIAAERSDGKSGADPSDIWLRSVADARGSRFASGLPDGAIMPFWRDDSKLGFLRRGKGLFEKSRDGGPENLVRAYNNTRSDLTLVDGSTTGMTGDGRILGFGLGLRGTTNIFVWPAVGGERRPFGLAPADEAQPALSPNGHWLAYVSNASDRGRQTIRIASFPDGGMRTISVPGNIPGVQPVWKKDGTELYYVGVGKDRYLYAVAVDDSDGSPGNPVPLFPTSLPAISAMGNRAHYDATRDGSRFIVAEPIDTGAGAEADLHVVVNWMSRLRK